MRLLVCISFVCVFFNCQSQNSIDFSLFAGNKDSFDAPVAIENVYFKEYYDGQFVYKADDKFQKKFGSKKPLENSSEAFAYDLFRNINESISAKKLPIAFGEIEKKETSITLLHKVTFIEEQKEYVILKFVLKGVSQNMFGVLLLEKDSNGFSIKTQKSEALQKLFDIFSSLKTDKYYVIFSEAKDSQVLTLIKKYKFSTERVYLDEFYTFFDKLKKTNQSDFLILFDKIEAIK